MFDSVVPSFRPKKFNWSVFLFLCALVFIAAFFSIPYEMAQSTEIPSSTSISNLESIILFVISALSVAFLLWLVIAPGMLTASRTGMGTPIFESFFTHAPAAQKPRKLLIPGILVGVSVGIVTILLLNIFAVSRGTTIFQGQNPAPWQGLLDAISAGIMEEILFRLFLLSSIAWVITKVSHSPEGRSTKAVFWIANLLSAIVFGLSHLPLASNLGLSAIPYANLFLVCVNAACGMVFGWLYRSCGLESAMVGHFSEDLILHVILPLLILHL